MSNSIMLGIIIIRVILRVEVRVKRKWPTIINCRKVYKNQRVTVGPYHIAKRKHVIDEQIVFLDIHLVNKNHFKLW